MPDFCWLSKSKEFHSLKTKYGSFCISKNEFNLLYRTIYVYDMLPMLTPYKFILMSRDSIINLMTIMGALHSACLFLGVSNASSVQPVVSTERTVFYREKAAGMYSPLAYAAAQVKIYGLYSLFFHECQLGPGVSNIQICMQSFIFIKKYIKMFCFHLFESGSCGSSIYRCTDIDVWHHHVLHDWFWKDIK